MEFIVVVGRRDYPLEGWNMSTDSPAYSNYEYLSPDAGGGEPPQTDYVPIQITCSSAAGVAKTMAQKVDDIPTKIWEHGGTVIAAGGGQYKAFWIASQPSRIWRTA